MRTESVIKVQRNFRCQYEPPTANTFHKLAKLVQGNRSCLKANSSGRPRTCEATVEQIRVSCVWSPVIGQT